MENSHTLQRKSHKTVVDYYNNSLDDFRVIVVSAYPSLISSEKEVIATSFGNSSLKKSVEMIAKLILTCLLRCCG